MKKAILEVENYSIAFDRQIMKEVTFSMEAGGKVAIVGPNGTGKTTILRDIYKNNNPAIKLAPDLKIAYLSQMHGEVFNEKETVLKNFEDAGFETEAEIVRYLKTYGFEEELVYNKVENLSGGEKNLLQLAKIFRMDADFLLLDEPTSHLDTYSQLALEQAIEKYEGAVLMVSHDFYTVANCMDYVLFVEEKKLRKMSIRKFRKNDLMPTILIKIIWNWSRRKKNWKTGFHLHCRRENSRRLENTVMTSSRLSIRCKAEMA